MADGWDTARDSLGHLSSGERRIFDLADSLYTGHSIDVSEVLSGLDDYNAHAVLHAIARCLVVNLQAQPTATNPTERPNPSHGDHR